MYIFWYSSFTPGVKRGSWAEENVGKVLPHGLEFQISKEFPKISSIHYVTQYGIINYLTLFPFFRVLLNLDILPSFKKCAISIYNIFSLKVGWALLVYSFSPFRAKKILFVSIFSTVVYSDFKTISIKGAHVKMNKRVTSKRTEIATIWNILAYWG